MSDKKKSIWESINYKSTVLGPREGTYRTRVGAGWLVRYKYFGGKWMSANCIIYFPDRDGAWDIENIKWELIDDRKGPNEIQSTYRLKVTGGWIVRDDYKTIQQGVEGKINHLNLSMTFVPDKEYVWVIEEYGSL
ncbi:MAG: hypothetical protein ISR65_20870 [Bacteriovoracaceae bacterium]|nr:hypothetical protein [Candidatus Brocadiales bacterium]MBL6992249.1 hypothetical protein [Bacteriovoracaceae bacterium]